MKFVYDIRQRVFCRTLICNRALPNQQATTGYLLFYVLMPIFFPLPFPIRYNLNQIMMIPFRIILLSALLAVSLAAHAKRRRFNSEWLASGVHDHTCFTQGFSFINSTHILESCGLYGQSFYHILEFTLNDLNETTLVQTHRSEVFPKEIFLEGSIHFPKNNLIYILTWKEKTVYRITLDELTEIEPLSWTAGEGWGMTHNSTHIFISTGSNNIYVCDQELNVLQTLPITDEFGNPLTRINEIEWVQQGNQQFIYANVWQTSDIVKISLEDRNVALRFVENKMVLDSKGHPHGSQQDVLNGIAFDEERQLFVLTGKKWPRYYVSTLDVPRP